jgi:hypothetical protein
MNPGLLPVDIFQMKAGNITRTKSHASKQQKDGVIPAANWCYAIARINDAFDILRLQILWQRRKTPMRPGGNACSQTCRTMTFGGEKAKEHPDTCCAQLRGSPSRLSGSFQDKLT